MHTYARTIDDLAVRGINVSTCHYTDTDGIRLTDIARMEFAPFMCGTLDVGHFVCVSPALTDYLDENPDHFSRPFRTLIAHCAEHDVSMLVIDCDAHHVAGLPLASNPEP